MAVLLLIVRANACGLWICDKWMGVLEGHRVDWVFSRGLVTMVWVLVKCVCVDA